MSEHPQIKGWCPTGWRPMASGDGWLLRIMPPGAEFSHAQLMGICALAEQYGNGVLALTNRGNLQLRGLADESVAKVQASLHHLGCLPAADSPEPIPAVLNTDWQKGDSTHQLAQGWWAMQKYLPPMPAKFGIALDAGLQPMLSHTSADIRVERNPAGNLLVRLERQSGGVECASIEAALAHLQALLEWFAQHVTASCRRVRDVTAALPSWHQPNTLPAPSRPPLQPGPIKPGWVLGVAMGQLLATTLKQTLMAGPQTPIRISPWRSIYMPLWRAWPAIDPEPWIRSANDPRSRIIACPGAPYCHQATVATRDLALALAPWVDGQLHVSGCAKRCASRNQADVELIGRDGSYDLTFPKDHTTESYNALTAEEILARLRRP